MALGLLGAAMAGGAEAAQDNAKTRIKQKRENALLNLKEKYQLRAEEREAERGAAATAAEWAREDMVRQEEQAHDIKLQGIKNRGGYGGRPPSRIQEADLLVARGAYDSFDDAYNAVRTSAGSYNESDNIRSDLDYLSGRLGDINEILNDRAAMASMPDDEVNALRSNRERIEGTLTNLENQLYEFENSTPAPSPTPNPAPTNSEGGDQPRREQGLRPGPPSNQSGDPEDRANDIMNSIFN